MIPTSRETRHVRTDFQGQPLQVYVGDEHGCRRPLPRRRSRLQPVPLASISQYHRDLYLRPDRRAALRLKVLERNIDGSLSDRVLLDQLQIARIFVKFSPTPAVGIGGRPVIEGMYHVDYVEDYDCPCQFGDEPFEVIGAARVLEQAPQSRTYFFRVFPDTGDRLIIADALKTNLQRTSYARLEHVVPTPTAVSSTGWGRIKRMFSSGRLPAPRSVRRPRRLPPVKRLP